MQERRDPRGDRRIQDRRMQQPVKRLPMLTMLPFVALAAVLGLTAGFFLARILDGDAIRVGESRFGPETGLRISKGRDFNGVAELEKLPSADRERFAKSVKLSETGAASSALDELAALRKTHPAYRLGHGLAALIRMGAESECAGGVEAPRGPPACPSRDSSHPRGADGTR